MQCTGLFHRNLRERSYSGGQQKSKIFEISDQAIVRSYCAAHCCALAVRSNACTAPIVRGAHVPLLRAAVPGYERRLGVHPARKVGEFAIS
jgi:hypothetical protein